MCKCIGGTLLSVMSSFIIGLCLVATLIILIIVETSEISTVTKNAEIILIVVLVVTAIVFVFAIYASCCGKIVARRILSAIFIAFAVVLIVMAICIFTLSAKALDTIGEYWEEGAKYDQEIIDTIQDALKCCGYNSTEGCPPDTERCRSKIEKLVDNFADSIGIILIFVAVVLLVCATIGCIEKCAPREDEDIYSQSDINVNII